MTWKYFCHLKVIRGVELMGIHIWWQLYIPATQIPLKCKLLMKRLLKVLHLSTSVILSWGGEGSKTQVFKNPFTVTNPSCQWTATNNKLPPSNKNWKALATATTSQRIVLWVRSWFFSSWHNKLRFTHAATWVHHRLQKPLKSWENTERVMSATCSALLQQHWHQLFWYFKEFGILVFLFKVGWAKNHSPIFSCSTHSLST